MSLEPASDMFLDAVIDAANALRIVAHNSRLPETEFIRQQSGDEATVSMVSVQCRADMTMSTGSLRVSLDVDENAAVGFADVTVTLSPDDFPGSAIFSDEHAGQGIPSSIRVLAEEFDLIQTNGRITAFTHDDEEVGTIYQVLDEEESAAAGSIQHVIHGLDAMLGPDLQVYLRHPALGSPGEIRIVDIRGSSFDRIPEGRPMADESAAFLDTLKRSVHRMPRALHVHQNPLDPHVFHVHPAAMTFQKPSDPNAAIRKGHEAIVALAALTENRT